jgi:hypothetical protein
MLRPGEVKLRSSSFLNKDCRKDMENRLRGTKWK